MVAEIASPKVGYRWVALGTLWLAWLVNVMDRVSMPSILPFIRTDLGLDHAQVGMIGAIYLLGYAVAQFPAGILSDRIGPKATSYIAVFGSVVTFVTSLAAGFTQLLLVRLGISLAEGHGWVPILRAQANWFPQQEKGRASALLMTAGVGALGLMPLLAAATVALTGDWRIVYVWLAGLGLVAMITLHMLFHSTPKDAVVAGRMGFAELDFIRKGATSPAVSKAILRRGLMHDPMLWLYSVLVFFNMAVYYGATTWLASFLYEQHSFNVAAMGLVAALPFFVGVVALLIGGWLVDKYGGVRWIIAGSFVAMIPILYFVAHAPSEVEQLVVLVALLGFFAHLPWTPIYSYQVRRYPKEIVGAAAGIGNGIGMLGGFASPVLAGFLVEQRDGGYSFQNVFLLLMVFAAVTAVCAVLLREDRFSPAKALHLHPLDS